MDADDGAPSEQPTASTNLPESEASQNIVEEEKSAAPQSFFHPQSQQASDPPVGLEAEDVSA